MSASIAALPMYDWPEIRSETDAAWRRLREGLRERGVAAPEALTRDLPLADLWRHPRLLLAQTCWGPMEAGLADAVQLVGQADYSAYEGGAGALYSSALLMRGGEGVAAPDDGSAMLPLARLRGARLAFNDPVSMSGLLALSRDLATSGQTLALFAERVQTGAHRASIRAVAGDRADVCAVDCRSWALARRLEPAAAKLRVVGWTARRPGLPFITGRTTDGTTLEALRAVLEGARDG